MIVNCEIFKSCWLQMRKWLLTVSYISFYRIVIKFTLLATITAILLSTFNYMFQQQFPRTFVHILRKFSLRAQFVRNYGYYFSSLFITIPTHLPESNFERMMMFYCHRKSVILPLSTGLAEKITSFLSLREKRAGAYALPIDKSWWR